MRALHETRVTRPAGSPGRSGRWLLVLACAGMTMIAPIASPGHAQEADPSDIGTLDWSPEVSPPPEEAERWWGGLGAVLCASEMRLMRVAPAIGFNPYAIAAGLGGCILAAMDVLTTE